MMLSQLLKRNVLILFGCQTVFVSGTVVLVTIGGIIGHTLAPDPRLATLPVALMAAAQDRIAIGYDAFLDRRARHAFNAGNVLEV